jgi:signal transduction histidine kinase
MLDSLDVLNLLDMSIAIGADDAPVAVEESAICRAREAERRRIARELHDGVVQTLTALVADLEYFRTRSLPTHEAPGSQIAQRVELWQSLARDGLDSMRQALGSLRSTGGSSTLDSTPDLPREVEALLAGMQGYRVEFECEDRSIALPGEQVWQLVAIVREALTNISKHANASRITIALFCFEERLFLSIADDGVGMKRVVPRSQQGNGHHLGLVGMRERVFLLGGRMTLESVPGRGTRIDIEIPCEAL